MSGALHRRRRAVALFRECLRSAARCPRAEHQQQMLALTRLKFGDARGLRDVQRAEALLDDGERELASLEYMHCVREQRESAPAFDDVLARVKQSIADTAAQAAARVDAAASRRRGGAPRPAPCTSCGAAFASTTAKFCSDCGSPRVSA